MFVSEDQRTVACISSPERRILIRRAADIPPLFVSAILASEDKNFFSHEGVDKGAIVRAMIKRSLGESHSGASTLTMQIAKHLRGGTGRASTEIEKIGDIVMALRLEREFPREQLLLSYVNMPYFGRGSYGIEAASRAYFDKPAADLALYQVAFIVSLINKPALPDRSFAMDPLLKTPRAKSWTPTGRRRRGARFACWPSCSSRAASPRSTTRARRPSSRSRCARRSCAPGRACGARDHFLERVRVLYKDRFPINTGGLTISITRDDALQDVLAKAVDLTLRTYIARHPDDPDNNLLRAGAFAVDFSGDVLAEVGNVNFKDLKYDIMASGWRQPGSTFKIFTYGALVERLTKQVLAEKPSVENAQELVSQVLERCTVLDAPFFVSLGRGRGEKKIENFHSRSEPQYRGEMTCRIALGRVAQHRGDARRGQRGHQERHRSCVSRGPAEGPEARASTVSDDGNRRFGGEPAVDGLHCGVRQRRLSGHATLRQRRLPRRQVAAAHRCGRPSRPIATSRERSRLPQERVMHPVVSAAMTELLKGPLDIGSTGTASGLRSGVIPGMDPLGDAIWKLKPDERKKLTLAFPLDKAGEIAGKTGTATNHDGKTSDVWLILFVPGKPDRPDTGIVLGFWMGKDAKERPLGDRGSTGGPGFAESGARNWLHSAATVLAFLQKERGLLQPGFRFRPITQDGANRNAEPSKAGPELIPTAVPRADEK